MIYLLSKFVILYSYVELPEGRFFYGPGDSRRSKPRSPFVATTSPFLITRLTSLTRKDMQQGDRHDMKWLNNRHCHSTCEMLHSEMIQNNSTVTTINFKKDNSGFVWCSILETFDFMLVSKQNVSMFIILHFSRGILFTGCCYLFTIMLKYYWWTW